MYERERERKMKREKKIDHSFKLFKIVQRYKYIFQNEFNIDIIYNI